MTVTAGEVALWTPEGYPAREPMQFDAGVTSAAFTADGRRLVTTSPDGTITVWDARRGGAAATACGRPAVSKRS